MLFIVTGNGDDFLGMLTLIIFNDLVPQK